jgi:hypothetical protein
MRPNWMQEDSDAEDRAMNEVEAFEALLLWCFVAAGLIWFGAECAAALWLW